MNILDIDAGNTRLKWRFSSHGCTKGSGAIINASEACMIAELKGHLDGVPVDICRFSSVRSSAVIAFMCAEIETALGVRPLIPDPVQEASGLLVQGVNAKRLGCDRWLAMLGARLLYPDAAVMVIDSGTALTLDVVSADGVFQGGLICPGLNTMLRAMTESADLLVLPDALRYERSLTFSSIQAIQNGALSMAAALIEKEIERFPGDIKPLLCGGDARLLAESLSIPVECHQDLIFDGLAVALPMRDI